MPADSVSIRIYSGIARFPCDSMAFLFDMTLQKNVISRVFLNFPKNVKNVFSNYEFEGSLIMRKLKARDGQTDKPVGE